MSSANDLRQLSQWFQRFRRPMLVSHLRPDGDSVGSLAAADQILRTWNLEPTPVLLDRLPRRYELLRDAARWYIWSEVGPAVSQGCDSVLLLDTCALTQIEPISDWIRNAPPTAVIDHHATSDPIATRKGDLRIIDASAAATCVLLTEWAQAEGMLPCPQADGPAGPIPSSRRKNPRLATPLFVGIATDCGWFRYSNTDARTMRAAMTLLEAGANPSELYDAIYQQEPAAKLRLVGRLLTNMQLLAGGRLALMTLRPEDLAATGADASMLEDLVNEAGRLAGCEATILVSQDTEGPIRLNFRSKRTLDVAALAQQFGGGGHTRAAGARVRGDFDEVVSRVVAAAQAALGDAG